jgi:hypothetical protein
VSASACEKCGERLVGNGSYCTQCGTEIRLSSGRGFRYGALAGFIEGAILTVYGFVVAPEYLAMNEMLSDIATAGYPEHIRLAYVSFNSVYYYVVLLIAPIFAIGSGAVLGLIFVKVQRKIPFTTVTRKALLFAFIVSSIAFATNLWLFITYRTVFMVFLQLIATSYIVSLIVNLAVGGLAFSYLLTKR